MNDPIPPGHGEPEPMSNGRGSNIQPDWPFDPTPIPPTPTEDKEF